MITEQDVQIIRKLYESSSKVGYRTIAKQYGVSWKVIWNIINRNTYRKTPHERFWLKVDRRGTDECWPWLASKNRAGYGQIGWKGKVIEAYRVSYELAKGQIPERMHVRHTCDNRLCCNPNHLILGTHADNMRDMKERGRAKKLEKRALSKEQAIDVKKKRESGATLRALASEYGVSKAVIDGIVYGLRYKEIEL